MALARRLRTLIARLESMHLHACACKCIHMHMQCCCSWNNKCVRVFMGCIIHGHIIIIWLRQCAARLALLGLCPAQVRTLHFIIYVSKIMEMRTSFSASVFKHTCFDFIFVTMLYSRCCEQCEILKISTLLEFPSPVLLLKLDRFACLIF